MQIREAPEMLDLYLTLYDLLNDDDEDVRDTGAAVVSRLRMHDKLLDDDGAEAQIPLIVPAARQKLLEMLKTRYYSSSFLWMESVKRLVCITPPVSSQSPPGRTFSSPTALLERLSQEDVTLFVEEKQNLYIDEAQEACVWQKVLLNSTREAIDVRILQRLFAWAVEGIEALQRMAIEKRPDGPLSWTSKPDIFTLGVRILLAAEALIDLSTNKDLNIDGDKIRGLLFPLSSFGETCCLNPTWLRMITDTLKIT